MPSWVLVVAISLASAYAARAQNKITLLAPLGRETIDKLVMSFESKTGEKVKLTYSGAAVLITSSRP